MKKSLKLVRLAVCRNASVAGSAAPVLLCLGFAPGFVVVAVPDSVLAADLCFGPACPDLYSGLDFAAVAVVAAVA